MEILVSIVWHLVVWLDGRFQKPLRQAIPDLEQFLADPADYFSYQEITIRPWRRWAGGVVLGLLLWLGLAPITGFIFAVIIHALVALNLAGPAQNLPVVGIGAVIVSVMPPGCFFLATYWLRGGSCVLHAEGVKLTRGGTSDALPGPFWNAPACREFSRRETGLLVARYSGNGRLDYRQPHPSSLSSLVL